MVTFSKIQVDRYPSILNLKNTVESTGNFFRNGLKLRHPKMEPKNSRPHVFVVDYAPINNTWEQNAIKK